jgi:hypothetical protein
MRTPVCWICLIGNNQIQYFEFISSAQFCYILYKLGKENGHYMCSHNKTTYSVKYAGSTDAVVSVNTVQED